jgi:hypothetical protein
MKQALVEVMLSYVQWFEATNSFALKVNRHALIPAQVQLLPETSLFERWVTDARNRVITKKTIDRAKQRVLYVAVDRDGRIMKWSNRNGHPI